MIANQPNAGAAVASNGRGFLLIVTAGSAILSYSVTSDGAVTFGSRLERTTTDIFPGPQALAWDGNSYVAAYDEHIDDRGR